MSALIGGVGQAGGSFLNNALNSVWTSLMGGDRISNRDFQFYQDLADSGNPREIARQNEFLAGTTGQKATSYNEYQDATYAQDSARQGQRINDIASSTGMSPWEVAGSSGAAPLPSPSFGGGSDQQSGNFLSQLGPLAIAKMNNQTQLESVKMQTDAQKEIAGKTNETSKVIANIQTNNGAIAVKETDLKAAQTALTAAQTSRTTQEERTSYAMENHTWNQIEVANNQQLLNAIQTLANLLPTTNVDLGMLKTSKKEGYRQLMALAVSPTSPENARPNIAEAIRQMPKDQFDELTTDVIKLSSLITQGARGGMRFVDDTAHYLNKLGKNFMK